MTTPTKHIPGPWTAHKYPDVKTWTVAAEKSIASKIETEDNARLIAAAPELLEALEAVIKTNPQPERFGRTIDDQTRRYQALSLAQTAIAKARGEEGK